MSRRRGRRGRNGRRRLKRRLTGGFRRRVGPGRQKKKRGEQLLLCWAGLGPQLRRERARLAGPAGLVGPNWLPRPFFF